MFDHDTRHETVVVGAITPFVPFPPRDGVSHLELRRSDGRLDRVCVVLEELGGWRPATGDKLDALYGISPHGDLCLRLSRSGRAVWPSAL